MTRTRITELLMALRHYALVLIYPTEVDDLDATGYRLVCNGDGTEIFMLFVSHIDNDDYNMLPGVVTKYPPKSHFFLHVVTAWTLKAIYFDEIHK